MLPTNFQLKIKEPIHIQWEQHSLNQQLHHVTLKLSFWSRIVTYSLTEYITCYSFFPFSLPFACAYCKLNDLL